MDNPQEIPAGQDIIARDFSETSFPAPELSYYDMTGKKYLVIFNHYKYHKTRHFQYKRPSQRMGTVKDVIRLTRIFSDLGYEVTTHQDFEHDKILDSISELSKRDHSSTSCICVAFLTHGDRGGTLFASDRPYQFKDVTTILENGDPGLVGKPKIFFVQACRGAQIDDGRQIETDGASESVVIPSHADFLVIYSTVEEYVAFRDRQGSFLIQELCDVIEEYHSQWDILHIVTLMQRRVAYYRATFAPSTVSIHEKKQMPETRFSLTKLFKF